MLFHIILFLCRPGSISGNTGMKINSLYFCRRCNRYDRCWACPPYDFDISARIGKYKYICITGTQIVPDPSSVPTIPAGTEKEVVIGLLTEVRLQLDSWLRWLETEYPGSLACYAGTCHLCPDDTCTRITGQPCRHPHLIRHSLESFGFDLGRTAEELLHIPLVWSDGGEISRISDVSQWFILPMCQST